MLSTILCLLLLGSVSASEISKTENDDYLHSSSKYSKYEKDDDNKKSNPITPRHIALGTLTIAVPVTILAALYKFLPYNNEAKLLQLISYALINQPIGKLSEFSNKICLIPGDLSTEYEMEPMKRQTLLEFCNTITPLRAFYWRNNLCWFYSTLLLLYYNPVVREAVLNFPVQDALAFLENPSFDLEFNDKCQLVIMIYLSKTFAMLQGKPDQVGSCVLNLDGTFERNFVAALNLLYPGVFSYGDSNGICTGPLLASLQGISTKFSEQSEKSLYNWSSIYCEQLNNLQLDIDPNAQKGPVDWFASDPSVAIESSGSGHFYLKIITSKNCCITIGKSTTAGEEFDVE